MTSAPRERAARRRGLAMRERAKRRVGELEGVLAGLQAARRESRAADAAGLEDRAIALLRGWRAELDRPAGSPSRSSSPASHHLPGNSHGSSDLSSYIRRMLQLNEEEEEEADDATSKPAANVPSPKAEPFEATEAQWVHVHGGAPAAFFEGLPDHGFGFAGFRAGIPGHLQEDVLNCLEAPYFVPPGHLDLQQQVAAQTAGFAFSPAEAGNHGERAVPLPVVSVAPSAFLQPKCALWDCPRPAQGLEWYHDYCSGFHATLAVSEGPPGVTTPVLRPGGIDLKDGPLFAALAAKTQGKNVGIPECPGAATKRSPWNAPELFDLSVLLGESLREWLFFDKPRRAFESGNRKQRSLPDYVGRGWHESRKQVMAEFGGLKRSYYMDPQPLEHYEWHLYEYEMSSCDACALYRLELKLADPRKGARGKAKCDTSADHDLKPAIDERHDLQAATSTTGLRELEEPLHSAADFVGHNNDGRKMFSALIERAEVAGDLAYGLSYGYAGDSFRDLYGT